jgi:hypothetical protein
MENHEKEENERKYVDEPVDGLMLVLHLRWWHILKEMMVITRMRMSQWKHMNMKALAKMSMQVLRYKS